MSGVGEPLRGTLPAAFQASARRVPERVALRGPGDSFSITWVDYAAAVERAAGSLAGLGVGRGDRVAFLSGNRPELAVVELAAMHLGAAGVALYTTSPPATIEHVLADSEPTVLLVESAVESHLAEIRHSVPNLFSLDAGMSGLEELASIAPPAGFDFEASWTAVAPEDLAALIYTSGTTGPAKGVEWTHRAAIGSLSGFDEACGEEDGIHDVCFAPFASLAERFGGHWHALLRGSSRTICEDPTQLGAALLDARPTRLGGPPQVWQRLKRGLEATLDPEERAVLDRAVKRFGALARAEASGPLTGSEEETLEALRARVGLDRIALAGSTAAACPLGVHQHYNALDVPFREFFAMTEAGVIAAQRPGLEDFGTLGPAVPGYELQIAPDGEVLVRSPHAPQAYRDRPRESAETYGAGGWIHTGDVGELDSEGRLRLIDRKKEMIVPGHGHNVSPTRIESALKDVCPLVAQVCVIGDGLPYLGALVVLDPPEGAGDAEACATVAAAIAAVNAHSEPRERIEAHAIVAEAWLPGAELTETLKLRRRWIAEKYAEEIKGLYGTTDVQS